MNGERETSPRKLPCRVVRVKEGYRIREVVTPDGKWIEWPGLYTTETAAQEAIRCEFRDRETP